MARRRTRVSPEQLHAAMAAFRPLTPARAPRVSNLLSDIDDVGPHDQLLLPIDEEEARDASDH